MKNGFLVLLTALYCAACLVSLGEEQKKKPENELIGAARAGDVAKLKELLDHGADIDARDHFTETALMNAADAGKLETLKELLARGAKVDIVNKDNRSAFFFAAFMGRENTALELLRAGAKFDEPDKYGCTPLITAACNDLPTVVDALLERGVDVNIKSRWGNAVLQAASSNSVSIASKLIAKGADVNVPGEVWDQPGMTPLHCAAAHGNLAMVQLLLKAGANLNAVSKDGRTPLMEAIEAGWSNQQMSDAMQILMKVLCLGTPLPDESQLQLNSIRVLCEAGADIDREDRNGDTALTIAGQKGRTQIVSYLLQRGAKKTTFGVNVSPYPVPQPLPPEKRWVLATAAIRAQANRDSHELLGGAPPSRRASARSMLRRDWNINNHHDALKVLYWLKYKGQRVDYARKNGIDPERLLGWDYCRYTLVAGKAYVAGYLTEREAWELAFPVAERLQQTYHSWKEMGESYLLGRSIWNNEEQPQLEAVFQLLLNPNDPNSPWNSNAWDTPLDGSKAKDAGTKE